VLRRIIIFVMCVVLRCSLHYSVFAMYNFAYEIILRIVVNLTIIMLSQAT